MGGAVVFDCFRCKCFFFYMLHVFHEAPLLRFLLMDLFVALFAAILLESLNICSIGPAVDKVDET